MGLLFVDRAKYFTKQQIKLTTVSEVSLKMNAAKGSDNLELALTD
jgi:hypothetical protein